MKKFRLLFSIFVMLSVVFIFTACNFDGPDSSAWTMSVNRSEGTFDGGFSISLASARRGHRNRTFTLTAEELSAISIASSSESGEIILIISQDGEVDGTEIRLDISNFRGYISTDSLNAGRIRFSLLFDEIRTSLTTISWN